MCRIKGGKEEKGRSDYDAGLTAGKGEWEGRSLGQEEL